MRNSPSNIEVMLHCYYSPEPHPRRQAPAVQQAYRHFLEEGLIVPDGEGHFKTTPKGSAWVEMICATPYPVKQDVWFDPRTNAPVESPFPQVP
jgi:hypothetical protein